MIHDREYRLEVNFAGRLRQRGRVFEATIHYTLVYMDPEHYRENETV